MPKGRVTAKVDSFTSPLGGWNARDSLAQMPQTDAVTLINLWPTPTDLRLRMGYAKTCTGFPNTNPINTVMTYNGNGGNRLFAAQGTSIYDATGSTAVNQNIAITSDKLEWINNSTSGGNFLVAVNGADTPRIFNGTNWIASAKFTAGQTISTITVSGTIATLTTSSPHELVVNNQIVITGAVPTALNGAWIVASVPNTTEITFTVPASTASATTVGSYSVTGYTGVDPATFRSISLWKNRQWFNQTTGTTVYFTDVNAISGAVSPFPLGSILKRGGNVVNISGWTLDAGTGVDDYLVFVTDQGEIAVYQGTNPTDATMFSLKGVWNLGSAFTTRCMHKFGGDLLLLLADGLTPLSAALQSSRLDPRVNITDKIYNAISQATTDYGTQAGWQVIYFPLANMLVINVPTVYGTEQWCMNTISKAWARFTDISAYHFTIFQDKLFFGGPGYVGRYWALPSDNGANINASVQQAYSYFGNVGQLKRFMSVRPIFLINGSINNPQGKPGVVVDLNVDYAAQNPLSPATFSPALAAIGIWDQSRWDSGAVWGTGNLEVSKEWQSVSGIGTAAGLVMNIACQGIDVRWTSTDYIFEPGAVF